MPIDGVSPTIHGCFTRASFHSLLGRTPVCSPTRSMPVFWPKPQGTMKSWIVSTLMRVASQ